MTSNRQACNYGSYSPCEASCPAPYANAWSQPCITSCGDSRAVVYPPPVTIVFPGPILSSCPQESIVGASAPLQIGGSLEAQSSPGSRVPAGGKYSYSCYSRSCRIYRPAKPSDGSPGDKTQQEQEQIRKP